MHKSPGTPLCLMYPTTSMPPLRTQTLPWAPDSPLHQEKCPSAWPQQKWEGPFRGWICTKLLVLTTTLAGCWETHWDVDGHPQHLPPTGGAPYLLKDPCNHPHPKNLHSDEPEWLQTGNPQPYSHEVLQETVMAPSKVALMITLTQTNTHTERTDP